MTDDLDSYLAFAQNLARQSGAIMRQHFTVGVAADTKADGSPVTIADTEINQLVITTINSTYPTHGVIGEEASSPKESDYQWVCDPIDGTTPYTFGLPISLFSLALVKDGEPIIGVMYDPYQDRMYHAIKGGGAFLNSQSIHVNNDPTAAGNYIALPGSNEAQLNTAGFISDAIEQKIKVFRLVCLTAESALVATGQIVACMYSHTSPWDAAAAKVIVEEAGGKVTDLQGEDQRYDQPIKGAIISNGLVHDQLVELARPYTR